MNLRKRIAKNIFANSRMVLLTITILSAYTLFAFNVAYNQPASHPQPLWVTNNTIVTHTTPQTRPTSLPIRKVEVHSIKRPFIPVPTLRPLRNGEQQKSTMKSAEKILADTRKVQRLLGKLGFYQGKLDGLMGPNTLSAVKKFEKSKGLPQNANISPSLLLLLQSAVDRSTAKSAAKSVAKSANGIGRLLQGEVPEAPEIIVKEKSVSPVMITRIQVGLINYGSDDVTIDGVMGDQTRLAIEQFQARFKLEVNGKPSQELIRKLESVGALTHG